MRARYKQSIVLSVALLLTAAACGSDQSSTAPTDAPVIKSKVPDTTAQTAPAPPTVVDTAATGPVTATGSAYTTKTFEMPIDVTVPGWLPAEPTVEKLDFVTWEAPDGARAVRVLLPVAVYPPGSAGATAPPKDYLAFLLGQTDQGAHFTDQTKTTVGGRPATIVTATADKPLEGSIGCPAASMTAPDCFGLQPDLNLRIAVIGTGDKTLLVWLRNNVGVDERMELESFDQMLSSIRFSDRAVQAPPAANAAATPVDGVWTATWTRDELAASPFLENGELNDENWGKYTLTFDHGKVTAAQTNPKSTSTIRGTFHVDGDTLIWEQGTDQFVMRWSIDGDQLTLTRDESLGIGPTPFVIRPYTRQP